MSEVKREWSVYIDEDGHISESRFSHCDDMKISLVNLSWHEQEMERVKEKLEHCRKSNKQKSDDYFKQMMRIESLTAMLNKAEAMLKSCEHLVRHSSFGFNGHALEAQFDNTLKELADFRGSK